MTAKEAWQKVVFEISNAPGDFKTVPKIQREAVWFYSNTDGQNIYVDKARQMSPSSRLSKVRKITSFDFETVHAYYARWSAGGVGIRDEVRQLSPNTAYIFALIEYFNVV